MDPSLKAKKAESHITTPFFGTWTLEMFTFESLHKFAKNNCIIYRNGAENGIYDYGEVLEAAQLLCQQFRRLGVSESKCFAINLKSGHTAGSVVLLIAILNHRCRFCPLQDYENHKEFSIFLRDCGASFLVSNDDMSNQQSFCEMKVKIEIFKEEFFLYSVENHVVKIMLPANMCYTIGTSGSTGRPKMVHVPYDCIAPNISALCSRFEITSKDIIFLGTPITFDPFVVELFMAINCGSALLIAPTKLRLSSQKLVDILWPKKCSVPSATILQMTPSLFRQFGIETIKDIILNENSALRILILGGEEFPKSAELKKWLPEDGILHKRIFNIYGITELSCWNTIHELKSIEIFDDKCIPIGQPIDDETTLRIIEIAEEKKDGIQRGELLIGSATRKTFIPQMDDNDLACNDREIGKNILYRHTGDFVERNLNDEIYYLGRLNNVIKRMGKRINLDTLERKIESLFLTTEDLKVICLWKSSTQSLICCLKYHNGSEDSPSFVFFKRKIMENLLNYEKPDWIIRIEELPLNKHGKMDRKKLLEEIITTNSSQPINIFKHFLNETLMIAIKDYDSHNQSNMLIPKGQRLSVNEANTKKSFTALGGTSFHALSLATEIGKHLRNSNHQRQLLEKFLDPELAVEDIFLFLENIPTCIVTQQSELQRNESKSETSSARKLEFLWRVDLQKCVDAAPAVDMEKRYICIGSHAHLCITVDAFNGKEVSRLKVRSRIECEAVFVSCDLALIGCNAGYLYAFNFLSGAVYWSLYIGCKVKAKPLLIEKTHAMIGCYDEKFNLVYVSLKTRNIEWRRKVGSKPIFSGPTRLDNQTALICTLDGTYERLDIQIGSALWTRKCSSPIFSTPTVIENGVTFGIAEVGGKVHICKTDNGDFLQSFSVEGNIFSNLTVHQTSDATMQVILGSHDCNVYCFNYMRNAIGDTEEFKFQLNWKTALSAAIFSSPRVVQFNKENYLIVCSTNGILSVLELSTGSLIVTNNLEGEVFSTPCCIQNTDDEFRIFFGCRDNFLYCFRLY